MKKGILLFIVIAVLWTITLNINAAKEQNQAGQGISNQDQMEELPRIGFKTPRFKLQGLNEEVYSLETLKGKPVVINFWASWCGPCRVEAPELVKLYEKYKNQLEIYAINLTSNDSIEGAKTFSDEYGFTFPVLLDLDGSVGNRYQIQAIPTTYFVNERGIIVDQVTGLAQPEQLEQKFLKLLNP